jgi:hypothetical protein
MADLPNPPLITADGDYDIKVDVGHAYLLVLKGTWNGATVTLKTRNDATGGYDAVTDGAFTADAEINFRPPTLILRLTVSGAGGSTSISVMYTKHFIKGN